MDHQLLAATIRRLALEAGAVIMEHYHNGFEVEKKADESPVTEADHAADALISAGLRETFPDMPLVTEEQARTHAVSASTFLIVDPLDGTKEFVRRRGDFTVNIALVEDGVPVRGVVYAPARKRLFMTDADGNAIEEEGPLAPAARGPMREIRVAQPDNDALRVVASKSHRDAETDAYIRRYRVAEIASAGSSLKFCLVATGEADLYPRLGPTMEWDTAAGHAVLAAAGGRVDVLDEGGRPLTYGKAEFRNPRFIAYAPGVELS